MLRPAITHVRPVISPACTVREEEENPAAAEARRTSPCVSTDPIFRLRNFHPNNLIKPALPAASSMWKNTTAQRRVGITRAALGGGAQIKALGSEMLEQKPSLTHKTQDIFQNRGSRFVVSLPLHFPADGRLQSRCTFEGGKKRKRSKGTRGTRQKSRSKRASATKGPPYPFLAVFPPTAMC